MNEVLMAIRIIEWLAKDIHYRSNDQWFYALHLLADKVDFGDSEDELKEAYYLGFREELPPTERQIAELAMQKIPDLRTIDNLTLIRSLYDACSFGIYNVEEAKREAGLAAGVHAILDGISQRMLTIKGLCWRTLNGNGTQAV